MGQDPFGGGDDPFAQIDAALGGAPPAGPSKGNGLETGPVAVDTLYWGVSIQTVDLRKLDNYLASVSDQEGALSEAAGFKGRMVLRSQRRPDRFWLIDSWTDEYSLASATIQLRTLSSVAGLVEEPRVVQTLQLSVGSGTLPVLPQVSKPGVLRAPEQRGRGASAQTLRFYLIAENWIKPVSGPEYLEVQDRFTRELEAEEGFRSRLLLRDLHEDIHYLVVDEWESEQLAFEAFERRQGTLSQVTMTRFLSFMSKRGEPDFALGLHGG